MIKTSLAVTLSALLLMTACGDTLIERTGSGAVTGAAIGGVSGALCCGDPVNNTGSGLFIGMAAGALIGFLLDQPIFMRTD